MPEFLVQPRSDNVCWIKMTGGYSESWVDVASLSAIEFRGHDTGMPDYGNYIINLYFSMNEPVFSFEYDKEHSSYPGEYERYVRDRHKLTGAWNELYGA